MKFQNDKEMFKLMENKLYTAVCCDVMDQEFDLRNQAMRHDIRPIDEEMIVVGRAKTVLASDVFEVLDNPYEGEIKSIDSVKEGEVVVACTNNSIINGFWGELLSTATKARGGRGAIIDGLTRDVKKIKELNFPVFTVGYKPVDSSGRGFVIDYDCPIVCGDVRVNPGDIIFGDVDGVIVIPKDVAENVVESAIDKVNKENMSRKELLNGKYLADVYEKYGVL